jgi:XTP/dITP diphosphohydrolase
MVRVLVATHNRGKIGEYEQLLSGMPAEFISLSTAGISQEIPETGSTFEENARIKAESFCRLSQLVTLADDSGLEVDALGGAPGVLSARYAGNVASDSDRYRLLLKNMADVPPERRTARFHCVIALATPEGDVFTASGKVEGVIAPAPRGDFGFGYDPVFFLSEYGATMAEVGDAIKNAISHRARALHAIAPYLQTVIASRG